jgi:T5SS/PEP-CTERM-associated repeat protein
VSPFNTRRRALATTTALLATLTAPVSADLYITTDTTIDAATLTIDPPGGLFVTHDSNNPQLTLTNAADSQGVEAVVIGSLNGESGGLLVEAGSTLSTSSSNRDPILGTYGSATVIRRNAYLGLNSDSVGIATVTGGGSSWTIQQSLSVGTLGTGMLTIANGGSASSRSAHIGDGSGSTGAVTVTGTEARWIVNSVLVIGGSGIGTLTIESGGRVSVGGAPNVAGWIGDGSSSVGTVNVFGPGSAWTIAGGLDVGRAGTGQLAIAEGGSVVVQSAHVGSHSSGTIIISDGGSMLIHYRRIGWSANSHGMVAVSGVSSTLNAHTLTVGYEGSATLNMLDDGLVTVGGALTLAVTTSGSGTINLDGGTLDMQGNNVVFGAGTAAFNFIDGTLRNVGNFGRSLHQQGGRLEVGAPAITTTIAGDYTQDAGTRLSV